MSASLARVRACVDAARASAADRQRHYAAQHDANAVELEAAGFPELAATYGQTAREHEATAERIEQEARP